MLRCLPYFIKAARNKEYRRVLRKQTVLVSGLKTFYPVFDGSP